MVKVPTGRRCVAVLALLGAGACGDRPPDSRGEGTASAFCGRVEPRVAAYLDSVARAHPVTDSSRYGGTLVVGGVAELPGGMNPAVSTDYTGTQYQQFVLLMTLVRYNAHLEAEPYLARSWAVNADTTELTFHLRDDVFWHDGVRTDANDVAFTFRTVTDPETGFPNPAYWDEYDKSAEGMTVVDDTTIAFQIHPHADFMDPWRATAILPRHLLEDVPASQLATHPYNDQCPVGNGPFAFSEHRLNDRWVFQANPGFPEGLGGRPYVDRLVHRIIPEQTTLLTEFLTGGIQVFVGAQPDQVSEMEDNPSVQLMTFDHREAAFVAWNSRRPQLSDARVRRALTLGVDRAGIVEAVLQGYGTVANSTVPPAYWQYDPSVLPDMPYDPDRARALLDEAGWKDRDGDGVRENAKGEPLHITIKYNQGSRQRQSIAELMQAQLRQIGVDIDVRVVDVLTLRQQLFTPERDFDGVVLSWVVEFRLDDRDLFDSKRIDGPWALSGTRNPELDRLLDTLQTVVDRRAAKPLWDKYQRLLVEEQPYTFLYFVRRIMAVRNSVHGVHVDARGEWQSAPEWWMDPSAR